MLPRSERQLFPRRYALHCGPNGRARVHGQTFP